jgi:hypothetical protein
MIATDIFRPVYIDVAPGKCRVRKEKTAAGLLTAVSFCINPFWIGLHVAQPKGTIQIEH